MTSATRACLFLFEPPDELLGALARTTASTSRRRRASAIGPQNAVMVSALALTTRHGETPSAVFRQGFRSRLGWRCPLPRPHYRGAPGDLVGREGERVLAVLAAC
jgi:hypothetical protein